MGILMMFRIALCATLVVLVTCLPLEDPLAEADDVLKHLDVNAEMNNDARTSLGQDAEVDKTRKKVKFIKKNKCEDRIKPQLCKLKSRLCDKKAYKTKMRSHCAKTCGLCKVENAGKKKKDLTLDCRTKAPKHCSSARIKRLCPAA